MESKSTSGGGGGVVRRQCNLSRYDPYAVVTENNNKVDHMKEGVVQLGVELSLCVAESMFLLCDDRKIMLLFCFMICKNSDDPVSERLIRVMHHVYTNEIISKNRLHHQDKKICPNSVHCGVIGKAWEDFAYGLRFLHRLTKLFRTQRFPFRYPLLSNMDTADIKRHLIKKIEAKLRSSKDVSQANGFERETLEPTVSETWMSLFDEEAVQAKATKIRLLCDLFQPVFGESWQPEWGRFSELRPLYAIGEDFAKREELREEAVRLGVELSLYAAESMFLVCDDIRSVLLFCERLWLAVEKDLRQPHDSPVVERLLRVFHYIYSKHIKPRNEGQVFRDRGTSVHWKLAMASFEDFHAGIRDLDVFVREGRQEFASVSIDEALKNIEKKLRRAKAVSKANGFERNAMESDVLVTWKSLFDKPTEDLWTLKMMRLGIRNDMFYHLYKERAEANSFVRSISRLDICN
ncbi:uncharacterized protein LOC130511049 [Raphanus sativus]|uniref:Uncharacterized protein LOC130511049 n=1 Tax=Raphanus sativus TaxID=3726 RepID=A0A9W3DIV4_RAPSA|nr:uncharacterized protein LOC130511049 [Raphanus sativus]